MSARGLLHAMSPTGLQLGCHERAAPIWCPTRTHAERSRTGRQARPPNRIQPILGRVRPLGFRSGAPEGVGCVTIAAVEELVVERSVRVLCSICSKSFGWGHCTKCHKNFESEKSFAGHKCVKIRRLRRQGFARCRRCGIGFASREAFDRHIVQYPDGDWCQLPEEVGLVPTGTASGWRVPPLPVDDPGIGRLGGVHS